MTSRIVRWLAPAFVRPSRMPGLRTGKVTLAAVVSFAIADSLGTSAQPVLAPLTALLVVQLTMYETVSVGVQRIGSVLAGVLVALGVAQWAGLTWWSLGGIVALSLVVGRVLRLGDHIPEVAISAMLVLAVGGAEDVAAGRIYETLIGAAVGVAVNAAIAPPLHVRPAGDALRQLATRIAGFLRGLATELRGGWSRAGADRWLQDARGLGAEVRFADELLARAEESARLNPRGSRVRRVQPRLRVAFTGLEHCYVSLRNLCRALLDRTYFVPPDEEASAYDAELRDAIAAVLDAAAAAIDAVASVTSMAEPADEARGEVEPVLADLHQRRDELSARLLVDPEVDPGAWEQHGALLAAVDRLRVEVEAALRPPDATWRTPRVGELPRQAVQRIVDASRRGRRHR